ncbi:MAG: substrate-binding domain-containing protein [Caldilineaceae bacterium]
MHKRLRALLALLLVATVVLAACGGGEPAAEAPAEAPAAEAPAEEAAPTEAPAEAPAEEVAPTEAPAEEAAEAEAAPTEEPAEEAAAEAPAAAGETIVAEPGQEIATILLPKFLGILVFDQANTGAQEAATELGAPAPEFTGPTAENSVQGQIETVTSAATQGVAAIMVSNNAGDQLAPVAQAAKDAGLTVVTWDSPIPSAEGEDVFVAQVDFDETGKVMADMAMNIIGEAGGQFAVLSASPDAANQNAWIAALQEVLEADDTYAALELVDIVYGNDQSEDSYDQALALVDKYPDLKLIMAPTTVGIAAGQSHAG